MRVILALLSAFVLANVTAAAPPVQDVPVAGGYQESSVTDPEVVSAARFAVREASRRQRRPVTLISIRRAETQVVAGLNYRLDLSVRVGGRVREVSAEVYRDLQRSYSLSSWEPAGGGGSPAATREVKVYLVALNDNGRAGKKIGCEDSLVPVTRKVVAGGEPLKAAVTELLSVPHEYEGGLGNYWYGENLKVRGVSVRGGTATIRITGRLYVAGICDEPRIEEQIKETARQFPGVRRVRVFVNGRPLSQVIR